MIRDTELVGLCQVIARDSGMEVTVGGTTSYITSDGNRLNIARMPMTPEGRLVAVGLGFHEVGHKLYSDISSDWGVGLQHDLTNIIEDVRETRDLIQDRPGAAFDIESAVNWYQAQGAYTPTNVRSAIRALALGLGYVELLGFPALTPELVTAREIISSEMGDGFLSLAEMILKKYPKMLYGKEGTAESIEMAKALCNLLEEEAKRKEEDQQNQNQPGQQQEDESDDSPSQGDPPEPDEGPDDDQDTSADHNDQGDAESPSESDTDEGDQEGGGDQQDDSPVSPDDGGEEGDEMSAGDGGTDSNPSTPDRDADQPGNDSGGQHGGAVADNDKGLSPDAIRKILAEESDFGDMRKLALKELDRMSNEIPDEVRACIPMLPRSERFYGDDQLVNESNAITATSRMRAKLMGMLQAVKRMPERFGTSGNKLSINRLIKMATGDPRIFKKRVDVVSINTAVVILLDASGSMAENDRMGVARDSAFALHRTLTGIGGVSVLSAAFEMADEMNYIPIQLLCTWGEKPAPMNFGVTTGDYTPTPWALWYARSQLLQRPEPRKICLLITDGVPYGWNGIEADTVTATTRLEKDGIEIAAIGINLPDVAKFWRNNRTVNNIEDLPSAMFGVMNELLTRTP